ncbi:MAG: hypothetical protein RLZZ436_2968 [Planctomycetota bacterium]
MEPRQLLSADVELETILTGSSAAHAEVEYKEKSDRQSLKFNIYNAAKGQYSVWVGGTQIGQLNVDNSRILEFEFTSEATEGNKGALPAGLTFTTGTEIRLVPASTEASPQMAGKLGVEGEDPRFESCVRFSTTTTKGEAVESEYEAEVEGSTTRRKFELTVWNLAPNSTQTVTIGGVTLADGIKIDALGAGTLRFSDTPKTGFTAFPAGFPSIAVGTPISIGTVVSGNYTAMAQNTTSAPISGAESKITLVGTGSLQGLITWETSASRRQFKVEVWGGTKGQSVPVTVQPPNGSQVLLGTITLNTKGYGRLQYDTADPQKPFPAAFPKLDLNTLFTVGQSLSGVFTNVGQSLAPDDRAAREAYQLDQTKDFSIAGTLSENHGGKGEKWIKDKAGKWHFITPDGSLYEWDGKAGANGRRIAILDDSIHAKPELLTQAKATASVTTDDSLLRASAARLDRELNLSPGPATSNNWGGLGEKWIKGNGKWYFITPDGTLTRWNGSKTASGTVVGKLDERFHEDTSKLTEAEKQLTDTEKVFAANTSLKITTYAQASDNYGGVNVKWLKSATNEWYFVRPNDELYLWDRRGLIAKKTGNDVSGTLISALTGAFANPTMLTTPPAKPPGTVASRAVLDDLFIDLPDLN